MLWKVTVLLTVAGVLGETHHKSALESEAGVFLQPICPRGRIIHILKAEVKEDEQTPVLEAQWGDFKKLEKDRTAKVMRECEYLHQCDFRDRTGVENVIYKIDYQCTQRGCPHSDFVLRHMVRLEMNVTEKNLDLIAHHLETQHMEYIGPSAAQDNEDMLLFWDPPERVEYEEKDEQCCFKTPAKMYNCEKDGHGCWDCNYLGEKSACHSIFTGEYEIPESEAA